MAYDANKISQLAHLKQLAEKVKAECASKTELTALSDRVDGLVTAGGEPNKLEAVKVNGTALTITDKAVDITVPAKVSDLTNDSKFQTDAEVAAAIAAADHMKRKIVNATADIDLKAADAAQYIYMVKKGSTKTGDKYDEYMVIEGVLEKVGSWEVDLSNYVQKDGDKVLSSNDFTDELLTKLNGIQVGANKYVHPAYDGAKMGFYKFTVDATGHISAAEAVSKGDITALGIPGENTQYSVATTEADGLMSKADKAKLDGMVPATEAEVTEMLNEVFSA